MNNLPCLRHCVLADRCILCGMEHARICVQEIHRCDGGWVPELFVGRTEGA